jgi:hypothetical protein
MDFTRIVNTTNYFKESDYSNEVWIHSLIYTLASSKMSTHVFLEDKSNWDVLDDDPDSQDLMFCTVVIPLTDILIKFKEIPGSKFYSNSVEYKLNRGDCIAFAGAIIDRIDVLSDNTLAYGKEFLRYPYETRLFKMVPKQTKGSGNNKYKVSVSFNDIYEIEVLADNPEQAKQTAIDLGFNHWDHVFRDKYNESNNFKTQKVRYTLWNEDDILVEPA